MLLEKLAQASAISEGLEKRLQQRDEDYEQLSERLLQLQDDERRRLARDLHDSTAQRLAALTMNLDLIERSDIGSLDHEVRHLLSESCRLAASCSQEVRTLAYLLHPPLLEDRGLLAVVRGYVEGFTHRSGIRVEMELGDIGRLPHRLEAALFRIVQESLTNVHRHASSATASIRLTSAASVVVLEIHDRGQGLRKDLHYRADAPQVMLGVGIQGMRERILQFGGTFDVAFTGEGTTVRVTVGDDTNNDTCR